MEKQEVLGLGISGGFKDGKNVTQSFSSGTKFYVSCYRVLHLL